MSEKINDGGPAFPFFDKNFGYEGMTLRDYFAAKALQGEIQLQGMEGCQRHVLAGMAYEIADAMLAARNKTFPPAAK